MTDDRVGSFINDRMTKLRLMERMWSDPLVQCYNDDAMPSEKMVRDIGGAIFLGGPTSRHQLIECNWRCEAVAFLREAGFQGFIYVPEPRGEELADDFTERGYIHRWESSRLLSAPRKMFWIPRKADELLGLNTNFECAMFVGAALIARQSPAAEFFGVGWPDDAQRMGLPNHYIVELAGMKRYETLQDLCFAAANV